MIIWLKENWWKLILYPFALLIIIDLLVTLYANLTCRNYVINYPWGQWLVRNYCDVMS